MTGRPLTRELLKLLDDAGEAGLSAGDFTEWFTLPAARVQRNSRVNQLLLYQAQKGRVRRGEPERSPRYHRAWTRRWFITEAGRAYLAVLETARLTQFPFADLQGQLAARTVERDFERRRYAALRAVLEGPHPLTVPVPERNRKMVELREAGCDLEVIGAVFGVTRERVRQIIKSLDPSQARG